MLRVEESSPAVKLHHLEQSKGNPALQLNLKLRILHPLGSSSPSVWWCSKLHSDSVTAEEQEGRIVSIAGMMPFKLMTSLYSQRTNSTLMIINLMNNLLKLNSKLVSIHKMLTKKKVICLQMLKQDPTDDIQLPLHNNVSVVFRFVFSCHF